MAIVDETPDLDLIESAFHWTENAPAQAVVADRNAQSLTIFAAFLCWLFDELLRVETYYREHRPRNRAVAERFRAAYQLWIDKARTILIHAASVDPALDQKIGLGSRIDDAQEILAEFATGEAGAKRLAELFREEEAGN
jgi:hypothetical protein